MKIARPANDLSELKSLVLSKNCVAFVGAGLSRPPGASWIGLVKRIAGACGVPFDPFRLPQVIDTCLETNESACNNELKQALPKHTTMARTAMNYIHRLPFRALLTTNFDPWVRQLAQQATYSESYKYPDLPMSGGLDRRLFYLHGCFDSQVSSAGARDLVLGERSFVEAYDESLLPGFLLNVFVYSDILFIGFHPLETHIAPILEKSAKIRKKIASTPGVAVRSPRRFILWPVRDNLGVDEQAKEDNDLSQLRTLDITPILYDVRGDDYRGIEELLFTWIEEGERMNRTPPFKSGFDP